MYPLSNISNFEIKYVQLPPAYLKFIASPSRSRSLAALSPFWRLLLLLTPITNADTGVPQNKGGWGSFWGLND